MCLDSVDVISFNSYPGWLDSDWNLEDNLNKIKPFVEGEATWAKTNYPHKPFLKSEIGAGAIYGWDDALNGFWTQEYQVIVR